MWSSLHLGASIAAYRIPDVLGGMTELQSQPDSCGEEKNSVIARTGAQVSRFVLCSSAYFPIRVSGLAHLTLSNFSCM